MSITIANLTPNLPAGVTAAAAQYPADSQAIKLLIDMLDAFNTTQAAFNATAPAGTDVLSLSVGLGNEQTIFWPPGQTTTRVNVRAKTYTLNSFQQATVTNVYPVIG